MKYCTKCGTPNEDTALFCKSCGASLSANTPVNTSPQPIVTQTPSTSYNASFSPQPVVSNTPQNPQLAQPAQPLFTPQAVQNNTYAQPYMASPSTGIPQQQMGYAQVPPEASTIKTFNKLGAVVLIVIGVIWILTILVMDILGPILGIIDIIFAVWLLRINKDIDAKNYAGHKNRQLMIGIVSIITGVVIGAILPLLAYMKFDNMIRYGTQQPMVQQSPPMPPNTGHF
ncbi:MAG: zinc-ribbon domain-containing protein [Thermoplasmata archaeon]